MATGIGAIIMILISPITLTIYLTQGVEGVEDFLMNLYESGFIQNMLNRIFN